MRVHYSSRALVRPVLRHGAVEFRGNRSHRCRDITIFLGFLAKCKKYTVLDGRAYME